MPKVRRHCGVGGRGWDPQIDPTLNPVSTPPFFRGLLPPKAQKWQKWPKYLKNQKNLMNSGVQCYLWPGWPQWTPEGGFGAEVVWSRAMGGGKCAKSGTPTGTPMHSYRARKKMKKKWKDLRLLAWNMCTNMLPNSFSKKKRVHGVEGSPMGVHIWGKNDQKPTNGCALLMVS